MIESEGTVTVPNSALPVSNSISASSHVSDSGFQVSTFAHHLLQSKEIPPLWDNCRPCQSPQRQEVVPQQKLLRAQTAAVTCRLLLWPDSIIGEILKVVGVGFLFSIVPYWWSPNLSGDNVEEHGGGDIVTPFVGASDNHHHIFYSSTFVTVSEKNTHVGRMHSLWDDTFPPAAQATAPSHQKWDHAQPPQHELVIRCKLRHHSNKTLQHRYLITCLVSQ